MGNRLARFRESERVTEQLLRGLHFDGGFVGKKSIKGKEWYPRARSHCEVSRIYSTIWLPKGFWAAADQRHAHNRADTKGYKNYAE